MTYQFNETLENEKLSFSKSLYFILIGIGISLILYSEFEDHPFSLYGYILSGISILIGIISLGDKIIIKVSGTSLIIERKIFMKSIINNYKLKKIKNISYRRNVKSKFYSSKGDVQIGGFDITPESMKNYYFHKEIISFEYESKSIEIGKWKNSFNGKELYNLLKNKKSI